MAISATGLSAVSSGVTPAASTPTASNQTDPSVKKFMDFMNESPAQQMEDIWLAQHHLTRADLAKMSPEKRDAILKQMAQDIKRAVLQKTGIAAQNGSATSQTS